MPDLQARADEFIAGKLAAVMSRPVVYARGSDSVTLAKRLDEIVMRLDRLDHDRLDLERRDERVP